MITALLRNFTLSPFTLQLPLSFSPCAFIWLVWRAIKKVSAIRRKWWSQFNHKPRKMQPELLLPSWSYFANAIKGWSEGIAFLDRMRDYFTLLAKSVQFKTTNYAKCDLGLFFVDTNDNPTFNLLSLSQIFGAHVYFLLKTPFKQEREKLTQLIVFPNYRNHPPLPCHS